MRAHVVINRDGNTENVTLIVGNARCVFLTERARTRLLVEMDKIGALCKTCFTICRSDELTNGVCSAGVGCDTDIDRDVIALPTIGRRLASTALLTRLWKYFVADVQKTVTALELPPAADNGKPW